MKTKIFPGLITIVFSIFILISCNNSDNNKKAEKEFELQNESGNQFLGKWANTRNDIFILTITRENELFFIERVDNFKLGPKRLGKWAAKLEGNNLNCNGFFLMLSKDVKKIYWDGDEWLKVSE